MLGTLKVATKLAAAKAALKKVMVMTKKLPQILEIMKIRFYFSSGFFSMGLIMTMAAAIAKAAANGNLYMGLIMTIAASIAFANGKLYMGLIVKIVAVIASVPPQMSISPWVRL